MGPTDQRLLLSSLLGGLKCEEFIKGDQLASVKVLSFMKYNFIT